LGAVSATHPPVEAQTITYQWAIGQPSRYQIKADLSGSLPIMNNVGPIDLEASIEMVYKVTPRSVDGDGIAAVDFRVEKAEAELAKIPLPVPFEDAQKVLNRSVVFHKTGAVKSVAEAPPLPFGVSIPGVDPQRLYTLICPIVFPDRPIKQGDTWDYKSELLGTEEAPARFTATVLESDKPSGQARARTAEMPLRVREEFSMDVDQKLNADKKPLAEGETLRKTRVGRITGSGVMAFSAQRGKLLRGYLTILAKITERYVGEPPPDEPAETVTNVKAVVHISPVVRKGADAPPRRNRP